MDYILNRRIEEKEEVFVEYTVIDELGSWNFGKWLSHAQMELSTEDLFSLLYPSMKIHKIKNEEERVAKLNNPIERNDFKSINPFSITKPEFINLFTPAEYRKIKKLADTDDIVFQFIDMVLGSNTNIDLSSIEVKDGIMYLTEVKILTPIRESEILSNKKRVK